MNKGVTFTEVTFVPTWKITFNAICCFYICISTYSSGKNQCQPQTCGRPAQANNSALFRPRTGPPKFFERAFKNCG